MMARIERSFIQTNTGSTLAYAQVGAGPDVVLIHGGLVTLEDMAIGLSASLSSHMRITLVDRPGHGESISDGVSGSPWRQAQTISAACDALGLGQPVVVGHSFGGAVALSYGLQFPERTAGIVALAPIAFPELRLEHVLFAPRGVPGAGSLINLAVSTTADKALMPALWRAMFLPQAMPDAFADTFPFTLASSRVALTTEGEDALFINTGLGLNAFNYPSCRVPVRIFGGSEDRVVNHAAHGELLATMLPDGCFTRLDGLGHMVQHFAQPEIAAAVFDLAGL